MNGRGALVVAALLAASPVSAQVGFTPIPQQSGPDAPPEAPNYPTPAAPAQTVPMPPVAAPAAPRPPPVVVARPPSGPQPLAPIGMTPRAPGPQASSQGTAVPAVPVPVIVSPGATTPAAPPPPGTAADAWQPRGGGDLRALDKVNARSLTVSGRVGQVIRYATLTIIVRACVVRAPDQPADSAAFLDITDSRPNAPSFHGWMFSGEPGLVVFEHPVYDVRVLGCRA
jgi:hypothetical protein